MDRSNFIGGSDAAAIIGLSRWGSPLSVWAEKTKQVQPKELDSEAVELGRELEDYVARRFMKKTGKKVRRVNKMLVHKVHPFIGGHIDRDVVGENSIFEAKTCSAFKAREWELEEIPAEYVIQAMHYLAVTGADRCYISVLIGNQDFKTKTIERDEKAIADLIRREVDFWERFVVPQVMPMAGPRDKDTLDELFPVAEEGETVELDDKADAIIESLAGLKADEKSLAGQIATAENDLRQLIGKAEAGLTPAMRKVYWGNIHSRRLSTDMVKERHPGVYEECATKKSYRKLIIKELKENDNG